jgi:hypothetical protein
LVDVLQRGKKQGSGDHINILANRTQGDIYTNRGNYEAAEAYLWAALSGSLLRFGPRDLETIRSRVPYQTVRALLQKHQETSDPLATCTEAFSRIPDEPLRCRSYNRSSSLPPVGHHKWKVCFYRESSV